MKKERTVLTQLRDVVPLRPLSRGEAERVAELQAARLLKLAGVAEPPVPDEVVAELPRFRVQRLSPLGSSGRTEWIRGAWHIFLNQAEPYVRQRFSLFHEFKHALDHPFIDFLYPTAGSQSRAARAEQVCDHFAACVLMPKSWVSRAYCDQRIQDLRQLARRFGVSQTAMNIRLQVLGLVEPTPRHQPYLRQGSPGSDADPSLLAGLELLLTKGKLAA